MTIAMVRNLSRIILLRVGNKTLVEAMHLVLLLLRVVVGQVATSRETIILVASLAINILSILSNHL